MTSPPTNLPQKPISPKLEGSMALTEETILADEMSRLSIRDRVFADAMRKARRTGVPVGVTCDARGVTLRVVYPDGTVIDWDRDQ